MLLSLFYRYPDPDFHSIENIFDTLTIYFPENIELKKVYAPYKSIGFINRLKIAIHACKNQGDINHITGFNHFIAPFLKKKKTILTIHDIGNIKSTNPFKNAILKLFWFTIPVKSVTYITVISDFTKQELLKYTVADEKKIRVIPNCVSPKFQYHEKKFNKQKPVILHIGTKANKNLLRLIHALKFLNCKLIIVGKLSKEQNVHLKTNNIDYNNYFNVSDEDLIDLYKKADIISFVSIYEGFGMPIIEANAVGRVVLTSNIEPMNTVAANAAYKVNPNSVKDIREAIQNIIKDDKLRNSLIQNGLGNVQKYRPANIAKQYLNIYNELIYNT